MFLGNAILGVILPSGVRRCKFVPSNVATPVFKHNTFWWLVTIIHLSLFYGNGASLILSRNTSFGQIFEMSKIQLNLCNTSTD